MWWVIIDEDGEPVENVSYLDHGEAVKWQTRKNTASMLKGEDKFYRLKEVSHEHTVEVRS